MYILHMEYVFCYVWLLIVYFLGICAEENYIIVGLVSKAVM